MKKIICLLLAAASVVSLAACSKGSEAGTTTAPATSAPTEAATIKNWPNTPFFKDIPVIGGDIVSFKDEKNDNGYCYTFLVNDIDYAQFKAYVKQLEAAGYSIYSSIPLSTETTDDRLPDKLPEGTNNASWAGKKRGFYVTLNWYADEFYTANNLPESYNVSLRFYTYDIYNTTTK